MSSSTPRQKQFFVLFLIALMPAIKALEPCLDWDTWWHLRVGQWIVQEQRLPTHDPFSQLGREVQVPWIAYSWLYELVMYGSHRAGGDAGVLVFRYVLYLTAFGGIAWFFLRHASNRWLGLGVLALATVSLMPFSSERPWHVTIFFTTLTLHAVLRLRDGAPLTRFLALPLLYVLWANIHIQFVMGFALLGFGWIATLLDRGPGARNIFILGALCTFATMVNPFHVRLFVVVWEYATQTKALTLVQELQPPNPREWYNWPMLILFGLGAIATLRRGCRLWDVILLASAAVFGLRMQRDLWYAVLVAGTVVIRSRSPGNEKPIAWWQIALVLIAATILSRGLWEAGLSKGKTIETSHAETYPVAAAAWVKENHPPGPLFNDFDWGGYLIWALPEYPVSMDGRTNLYGEARLIRSFNAWSGEPDWETHPDLLRAGVIIAPKKRGDKEFPLTELLRNPDGPWKIVFEDKTAVVFVRK